MDDGRLLHDEPRPKRFTAISDAVTLRGSSKTPSYPKYNKTVSNIQSNESQEKVKLIRAATMGLVIVGTPSPRAGWKLPCRRS